MLILVALSSRSSDRLRGWLDRAYDVATYLREPQRTRERRGPDHRQVVPRQRMMARYAALSEHLTRRGVDRLVVVAHSQGSVLSATLLAEPLPHVHLPGEVALVTFGSPLRQLYAQRLPGAFSWVAAPPDSPDPVHLHRVTLGWTNLAAARDPVGRTVFADPSTVRWDRIRETVAMRRDGVPLREVTLGAGGHGTYWTHPALYREIARFCGR